jgi:hypothetical protein
MAFEHVEVYLQASDASSEASDALAEQLGVRPRDKLKVKCDGEPWEACRVLLLHITREECKLASEDDPSAEFADRLARGLAKATSWLRGRPEGSFDRCRTAGRELVLVVECSVLGMDSSRAFDIPLPAAFVRACGEAGLPIQFVSYG